MSKDSYYSYKEILLFIVVLFVLTSATCDGCRLTGFQWKWDGITHRLEVGEKEKPK